MTSKVLDEEISARLYDSILYGYQFYISETPYIHILYIANVQELF